MPTVGALLRKALGRASVSMELDNFQRRSTRQPRYNADIRIGAEWKKSPRRARPSGARAAAPTPWASRQTIKRRPARPCAA